MEASQRQAAGVGGEARVAEPYARLQRKKRKYRVLLAIVSE